MLIDFKWLCSEIETFSSLYAYLVKMICPVVPHCAKQVPKIGESKTLRGTWHDAYFKTDPVAIYY